MAEAKFHSIYKELVKRIKAKEYQGMLPTEHSLTSEFHTSRNTIRRAISMLNDEGYVYSVKGRGVVILESFEDDRWSFGAENFGGLQAITENNQVDTDTEVIDFRKIIVTEDDCSRLPFGLDEVLYEVERIRMLNGQKMMIDHSYFRVDQVPEINKEVVAASVYQHFTENDMKIAAAKRRFLVKAATEHDQRYLDLGTFNCVGVIENLAFNDMGKLFEYTESRFVPGAFDLSYFVQNN